MERIVPAIILILVEIVINGILITGLIKNKIKRRSTFFALGYMGVLSLVFFLGVVQFSDDWFLPAYIVCFVAVPVLFYFLAYAIQTAGEKNRGDKPESPRVAQPAGSSRPTKDAAPQRREVKAIEAKKRTSSRSAATPSTVLEREPRMAPVSPDPTVSKKTAAPTTAPARVAAARGKMPSAPRPIADKTSGVSKKHDAAPQRPADRPAASIKRPRDSAQKVSTPSKASMDMQKKPAVASQRPSAPVKRSFPRVDTGAEKTVEPVSLSQASAQDVEKPAEKPVVPVAPKPEPIKPEPVKSEATKPEAVKSEATKPEATKPEATKPEASAPAKEPASKKPPKPAPMPQPKPVRPLEEQRPLSLFDEPERVEPQTTPGSVVPPKEKVPVEPAEESMPVASSKEPETVATRKQTETPAPSQKPETVSKPVISSQGYIEVTSSAKSPQHDTPKRPEPKPQPVSAQFFNKAVVLRDRNNYKLAAQLFSESAKKATDNKSKASALYEEISCYIKEGDFSAVGIAAGPLKSVIGELGAGERHKIEAIFKHLGI